MKNEVITTGNIFKGVCDINKEGCKASINISDGVITSVFDNKREVYVCNHCLHKKLDDGSWFIKGALTPKQMFQKKD